MLDNKSSVVVVVVVAGNCINSPSTFLFSLTYIKRI